jgi:hypothetical protein
MKFMQRLSSIGNDQKKSAQVTRLLAPLVLAFMLFAFAGFTNSGHAFASTTSKCGNQVRASGDFFEYNHGISDGTLNLVQDTCTGLFHGEVVCTLPNVSVEVFILVIVTPGNTNQYNTVDQTCSNAGQTIETAPLAYKSSVYFCSWGFGSNPADGDGGNSNACITHK